jgi:hypothetical protein
MRMRMNRHGFSGPWRAVRRRGVRWLGYAVSAAGELLSPVALVTAFAGV